MSNFPQIRYSTIYWLSYLFRLKAVTKYLLRYHSCRILDHCLDTACNLNYLNKMLCCLKKFWRFWTPLNQYQIKSSYMKVIQCKVKNIVLCSLHFSDVELRRQLLKITEHSKKGTRSFLQDTIGHNKISLSSSVPNDIIRTFKCINQARYSNVFVVDPLIKRFFCLPFNA